MRGRRSGLGAPRPISGHTNDVHDLRVHGNVFFGKIGPSAIEFNNTRNFADGNAIGVRAGAAAAGSRSCG